MDTLASGAMTYCNYRILIGGVVAIFVALSLFSCSYRMVTALDTSSYIETKGTQSSAYVTQASDDKNTYYVISTRYIYVVDGKTYDNLVLDDSVRYASMSEAEKNLSRFQNSEIKVFYDPKNPENNATSKNAEDSMAQILSSVGVVIALLGGLSIAFRKNKIFCGMTIASDVSNAFFS